jgi:hypothetical protein
MMDVNVSGTISVCVLLTSLCVCVCVRSRAQISLHNDKFTNMLQTGIQYVNERIFV